MEGQLAAHKVKGEAEQGVNLGQEASVREMGVPEEKGKDELEVRLMPATLLNSFARKLFS
jgi:hypothetical protein